MRNHFTLTRMTMKVHCLWDCKTRQLLWKQFGSSSKKKGESSRKTFASALLTRPKPLTVWITANWKILKEMGIPEHLTCLLRNLYAGQEATVRTGHGTKDWFQIEYVKAVYCHPAYLASMQSTSWKMLGWKKHRLESRFSGETSVTSDKQMTPPLWQKVKN